MDVQADDKTITFDDFSRWSVELLKKFIKERGLSVGSKRKAELVSLAYAASVMKLPVKPSKEVIKDVIETDYRALLHVELDDVRYELPDPFTIDDGWLDEKLALHLWPPCSFVDIWTFFSEKGDKTAVAKLSTAYKEGCTEFLLLNDTWYIIYSFRLNICLNK